jgi:hypothetical protein
VAEDRTIPSTWRRAATGGPDTADADEREEVMNARNDAIEASVPVVRSG